MNLLRFYPRSVNGGDRLHEGEIGIKTSNGAVTDILYGTGQDDTEDLPSTTIGLNVAATSATTSYAPANAAAAVWAGDPPTTVGEALDAIAAFLET